MIPLPRHPSWRTLFILVTILGFLAIPSAAGGDKKKRWHRSESAEDSPTTNKYEDTYSLETNELPPAPVPLPLDEKPIDMHVMQRPFRMAKLNLVWTKALQRLTQTKLKSLFLELRLQDKAELDWKQQNGQHQDKDGLKEAELRKKLIDIMSSYGMLEHFEDLQDPAKYKPHKSQHDDKQSGTYRNKSLFKDKKLNKLWEKAEVSGFTPQELAALREEFQHHQEKVDVYYSILDRVDEEYKPAKRDKHENAINKDELDPSNEIGGDNKLAPNKKYSDYVNDANLVREKQRDIRDSVDRLERTLAKGPANQDFIEPRVLALWRMATEANFDADELGSIKIELLHYESRLLKLRHLNAENALNRERNKNADHHNKHAKYASMDDHIKKQSRKVEKIHEDLEKKIFNHAEL